MMIAGSEKALIFVAVVRFGGITAAADTLAKPKSSVSRAISELENRLGVRLFDRNSRQLRLTTEGEQFYQQMSAIYDQVDEAFSQVQGLSGAPKGPLSVALPMAFGREVVGPRLADFMARYPQIELDVRLVSQHLDMIKAGVDLSVEVGPLAPSDYVAVSLVRLELILVGAPRSVAQLADPQDPECVAREIRLIETRYGQGQLSLTGPFGRRRLALQQVSRINDPLLIREAVRSGAGISILPSLYCEADLRAGHLQRVCDDAKVDPGSELLVMYPSRRFVNTKSQLFIQFLRETVETHMGALK
ncbi:MAG: LysR family transcriptional regulator [Gammaproteobacteria bacterium]|nr:LysR family transcriptional regulator [Gammaproteobacteria bacterium]